VLKGGKKKTEGVLKLRCGVGIERKIGGGGRVGENGEESGDLAGSVASV